MAILQVMGRVPRCCLVVAIPAILSLVGNVAAAPPIATPIGTGSRYHPLPSGEAVESARPIAGMACSSQAHSRFGAHLEVFAKRRVVVVPPGIGIAPPRRAAGLYAVAGRCSYPARTREPTGVVEVVKGSHLTVGQLFSIWGQPLGRGRLAGFRAADGERVLAFVDGVRWGGDPRSIRLARHAEIVLEIGGFVPPHTSFRFRRGL